MKTSDRIIYALDCSNREDALRMVNASSATAVKVGLELFLATGTSFVTALVDWKFRVMLDLKLHDIPETVRRAVARAGDMGVELVTMHASAGPKAIEAAVLESTRYKKFKVVVVTVLTSLDANALVKIGFHDDIDPAQLTRSMVYMARESGADTFVCSPHEATALRRYPNVTLITPGIRTKVELKHDQARTATATQAIRAGADRIVVGRPIRDASNPKQAFKGLCRDVSLAIKARESGKALEPLA